MSKYVGLKQGKVWERAERSEYYCGRCGWKVTDHDSFCPECGGRLHEALPLEAILRDFAFDVKKGVDESRAVAYYAERIGRLYE